MALGGIAWIVVAALVGAAIGGALGATRSCESGGCPLTASPGRGAIMGALLGVMAALAAGVGGGSCPFGGSPGPASPPPGEHASTLPALTPETFSATVANGVVLVDFWASWCGPCQRQLPILETLAPSVADRFAIAKVNVDEQEALAKEYGISRLPTLVFFRDGKPVQTLIGLHDADALLKAFADLPSPATP